MQKDIYNVVVEDQVYLILEDEFTASCKYLGTVNHKFRFHKPEIKAKALNACHQNK